MNTKNDRPLLTLGIHTSFRFDVVFFFSIIILVVKIFPAITHLKYTIDIDKLYLL